MRGTGWMYDGVRRGRREDRGGSWGGRWIICRSCTVGCDGRALAAQVQVQVQVQTQAAGAGRCSCRLWRRRRTTDYGEPLVQSSAARGPVGTMQQYLVPIARRPSAWGCLCPAVGSGGAAAVVGTTVLFVAVSGWALAGPRVLRGTRTTGAQKTGEVPRR